MDNSLYLVRFRFDTHRLAVLSKERGIPMRATDSGYVIHTALRELFQDHAPRVFTVEGQQSGTVSVLAYSSEPLDDLLDRARLYADPLPHGALQTDRSHYKPMPTDFRPDSRLGFRLRACPVRRRNAEGPDGQAKGAETDAFLLAAENGGNNADGIDRESAYASWLRDQLDRRGGALLEDCHLKAFKLARLVRRHKNRNAVEIPQRTPKVVGVSGKPDATLEGTLRVTANDAFVELLRHGIGRHRAFGFGMLLLYPA